MTDPLDLDLIEEKAASLPVTRALVVELRTARARIDRALAICDDLEGEIDLAYAIRAALSGAIEPATGSESWVQNCGVRFPLDGIGPNVLCCRPRGHIGPHGLDPDDLAADPETTP